MAHHPCFDGNVAASVGHEPGSHDARRPAAAEVGAPGPAPGSTVQAAGLLGGCPRPRNEGLGATSVSPLSVPVRRGGIVIRARRGAPGASPCELISIKWDPCGMAR
jgi:hypothetical protein